MVGGMDGGQFLGQESRLGGRNDEGNSILIMETPCLGTWRLQNRGWHRLMCPGVTSDD